MGLSSWLLLAIYISGSGFGDGSLGRPRRQGDRWRPVQGSSRRGGYESAPRLGAFRGGARWGDPSGERAMLRQMPQAQSSPIDVQCGEDFMVVRVNRDLHGNGKLLNPSDLSLGSQACPANDQSGDPVVFQVDLQDCGNIVEVTPDFLIYATNLTYIPSSYRGVSITRSTSAVIPIYCYYNRHGNVSSKAIEPTWLPFRSTESSEEKLSFFLRLMESDWSNPTRSTVFQLGDILYIEASVLSQNHIDLILFVDNCVATLSPDPNSMPQYPLITANGCLVDGVQKDATSAFISPRIQKDTLRFTIDAFIFSNVDLSLIYITCLLRVASASQTPDPMNKACSYSKTNSWTPVEGSSNICQCCKTGNCNVPTGGTRSWGNIVGRPRGMGKREVAIDLDLDVVGQAVLGPLLVTGSEDPSFPQAGFSHASETPSEYKPVEVWVLVVVAVVSMVVVAAGVAAAGKCIMNVFCKPAKK